MKENLQARSHIAVKGRGCGGGRGERCHPDLIKGDDLICEMLCMANCIKVLYKYDADCYAPID